MAIKHTAEVVLVDMLARLVDGRIFCRYLRWLPNIMTGNVFTLNLL